MRLWNEFVFRLVVLDFKYRISIPDCEVDQNRRLKASVSVVLVHSDEWKRCTTQRSSGKNTKKFPRPGVDCSIGKVCMALME